jgi:hypothetical protein
MDGEAVAGKEDLMSGGSYDYLYLKELDSHVHLIEEMANRLKELGYDAAAARTREVVTKFAEIVALQTELESVWHAVEWLDSCDWTKETVAEILAKWQASRQVSRTPTHWKHPWPDVVIVPIEELVQCDEALGVVHGMMEGGSRPLEVEDILKMCRQRGELLDAYILPAHSKACEHCIGVRYGDDPGAYIAMPANQAKTQVLLDKYKPRWCNDCGFPEEKCRCKRVYE